VELEPVLSEPVGDLAGQVLYLDDFDRVEGTPFDAHVAACAEYLRNLGSFHCLFSFHAFFLPSVYGADLPALMPTLFGFAFVRVYYRHSFYDVFSFAFRHFINQYPTLK
jgi:hypothetical protein